MQVTLANLLAVLLLAGVLFFMAYYWSVLRPRKGTLDWVALQEHGPLTFQQKRHPMERRDMLPILLITAIYAFTAFFSLGDLTAPDYRKAFDFVDRQTYTLQVEGGPIHVEKLWYYPMLGTGSYNLEISADGQSWSTLWSNTTQDEAGKDQTSYYWADAEGYTPDYALEQGYNHLFKWHELSPSNPQNVRYIRITGRGERDVLQLGKLLFLDESGKPVPLRCSMTDGSELDPQLAYVFTVDDTVPDAFSWRNSAYFDEIYHPRTALEHIVGAQVYEWTHPPLGKLIIGLGIRMFGMTPFGWRFMGVLFGTLMVPLMYLFLKNIFGKTVIATCGTILFASEFMHLTQTRIATIDTYGVFFTLVSYYFFYRWLTASATPDKKGKTHEGYGALALSGIFWGIGCACKWTVLYAGAGLAVLYLIHMVQRIRFWDRSEGSPKLWPWLCKTLGLSVLCFVLIPFTVYTLAYIPYAQVAGMTDYSLGNSLAGLKDNIPVLVRNLLGREDPGSFDKSSLTGIMLENQWSMLHYHSGVHSPHPYSSRWYQWLVDARPILYYSKNFGVGQTQRFAAFTNPLVAWTGLLALGTCVARCVRRLWAKLTLLCGVGVGCCAVCWLVGRVENGDFDPVLTPQQLTQRFVLMGLCLILYLTAAVLISLQTESRRGGLDVFIAVGFAAQFLPWVFIGRITFAYHYFPSTLFLVLAICRVFDDLMESKRGQWKVPVYALTGTSAGLYLLFYPALTGLTMASAYSANVLKLLPSWPL